MERTLRALITDLKDHGLRDKTLILTTGKFGCRSKINKNAGRDLAATVFHDFGIAQNTTRLYPQGRTRPVLTDERKVITELVG